MSLFGTILSKIFPSNHPAVAQNQQGAGQQSTTGAQQTAQAPGAATGTQGGMQQPQGAGVQAGGGMQGAQANAAPVDVESILDGMAQKNTQKLNWRTSIVDLMKLLNMDSSIEARKTLASELNYTGNTSDSAAMNIWLHKQVMTKFAANGGKLPPEIKH